MNLESALLIHKKLDEEKSGDLFEDTDIEVEYLYFSLRLKRQQNEYKEALEYCEMILGKEANVKREQFIIPYTLCEKAEILLEMDKEKNVKEAKSMFSKVMRFKGYDFDKPLLRRVGKNLDDLGKKS